MNYKQLYRWITISSGISIFLSILAFVIVSSVAYKLPNYDFEAGGTAAVVIPSIISIIIGSTALYSYVKREDENFNESIVIWQGISDQIRELHLFIRNITTDGFLEDTQNSLSYLNVSSDFFLNKFNNNEIFKIIVINRSFNQKKGTSILTNHYNRLSQFKKEYLNLINVLETMNLNPTERRVEFLRIVDTLLELSLTFIAELEDLNNRKRIEELLIKGEKIYLDILNKEISQLALNWIEKPFNFELMLANLESRNLPIRNFIYEYFGKFLNSSLVNYEVIERLSNKEYCIRELHTKEAILYHGNNNRRRKYYSNGRTIIKGRYYYIYLFDESERGFLKKWLEDFMTNISNEKADKKYV